MPMVQSTTSHTVATTGGLPRETCGTNDYFRRLYLAFDLKLL